MITFGFENKYSGIVRALIAVAIGLVMVIKPDTSLIFLVKVIAAVMIASGIVSLFFGIKTRNNGGFNLLMFNTGVDLLIGVLLFMFPGAVASFIIILLGIALLIFGIFQIAALASAAKFVPLTFWSYLLPVICTGGGVLILFNPFGTASTLTLVAGIAVLVYGVSEFFATWKMTKAKEEYDIRYPSDDQGNAGSSSRIDGGFSYDDIKDAEFEKADDNKKN